MQIGGEGMKYSNIWFDADGTLFDFLRCEAEAVFETMEAVGIVPSDELVHAYSEINDGMWKMLERGEIEKSELVWRRFAVFCDRFGFAADPKEMSRLYESRLATKCYLLDGAEALIRKLSPLVSLDIVTNGLTPVQRGRFAICPFRDCIDGLYISGEVGFEKPDVRYFEAVAAAHQDFCPKSTLIVGDSLTSDMRGGVAFGIDTCFYNPQGKTVPQDLPVTYVASDFDEIYRIITEE